MRRHAVSGPTVSAQANPPGHVRCRLRIPRAAGAWPTSSVITLSRGPRYCQDVSASVHAHHDSVTTGTTLDRLAAVHDKGVNADEQPG
jgi:hypothetical protein